MLKPHKSKTCEELITILKNKYTHRDTPDIALSKFLNFKQTSAMSVQEFYDKAQDLSLGALVIDGIADGVAQQSRNAILHAMLL